MQRELGMRSPLRLVMLVSGALFAPLAFPLLTGRVFTKDDLGALHLPFRFLYQHALLAGDSFLWTPAFRSGLYLHGEGEGGFAHPFHLLLYRWLPLGPAFNLEIIGAYALMLAGTGLLLRRLALSREAAWFGAMAFTFSGFNLFNLMHVNHIAAFAHAPWMLLCGHVLVTAEDRRDRALAFGGMALAVGSQLLVGNPQYVWLTLLVLGYMTLCLLYNGAPYSRIPLLLAAMIAGVLVGAVQLLPTLDFAAGSTRAAWSLDERLAFSLSPLNLVQLWSPFAFQYRVAAPASESQIVHEFIVYNGGFCTVALAWIAMRWREQRRRGLLVAMLGLAGAALILAFGRHAGVYTLMADWPGVRNFRAPARHVLLFQLALCGIAAVVLEDMVLLVRSAEKVPIRRLWPLAATIAMSVTLTAVAAGLAGTRWAADRELMLSGLMRAAPWAAIVVFTALVAMAAARGAGWAVLALIVLAAFDQGLWGYSYAYRWGRVESVAELASHAAIPPGVEQGQLIAPMPGGGPVNLPVLLGFRLTDGYIGIEPSSMLNLADPLTDRIAGAVWRPSGTNWTRVPDTMSRARLLTTLRATSDVRSDVRTVDIATVALVEKAVEGLAGPNGSVRILSDRPGLIVVDTDAPGRQLLVLTERFHDGWRVRHDDAEGETLRVYGDYLGCVVDRGQHRVTFSFAPPSARHGLQASLAGLAVTFAGTALLWPVRIKGFARGREAAL